MSTPPPVRLGVLPYLIFRSRWLQLPLYPGLIVAQGLHVRQTTLHTVFILSAIGIAWTDRLMHVAAGKTRLAT